MGAGRGGYHGRPVANVPPATRLAAYSAASIIRSILASCKPRLKRRPNRAPESHLRWPRRSQ